MLKADIALPIKWEMKTKSSGKHRCTHCASNSVYSIARQRHRPKKLRPSPFSSGASNSSLSSFPPQFDTFSSLLLPSLSAGGKKARTTTTTQIPPLFSVALQNFPFSFLSFPVRRWGGGEAPFLLLYFLPREFFESFFSCGGKRRTETKKTRMVWEGETEKGNTDFRMGEYTAQRAEKKKRDT